MKKRLLAVTAALIMLPMAAIAHDMTANQAETSSMQTAGTLQIMDARLRATPPNARVAAGYMNVRNAGADADRLIGGTADFADKVEIHEMSMEGGVMKMRPLSNGLEIAPGETVELAPGGYHLMLTGLNAALQEGQTKTDHGSIRKGRSGHHRCAGRPFRVGRNGRPRRHDVGPRGRLKPMLKTVRLLAWAAIPLAIVAIAGVLIYQSIYGGTSRSMIADTKMGGPFELVDQNGDPITEKAIEGHPAAVFFGFTHCPEVCPTTLYELAGWLDQLGEEGKDIRAFFISVDPERDTPATMKAYVENFTDRITGITGDPEEIGKLEKAWHIYARKVPLDEGGYTMDHTASVLLVDAEGRFKGTIAYGESSETAVAKLRRLAKG